MSNFDLNIHTARLLMDEPFFASISRRIDKRATYAIPTAGVMVNPTTAQFEMLYNPEFFEKLTDNERRDVLKHEFYHVVFLHVTSRMPESCPVKRWNIAADLAINSHLNHLPEGGLIPGEGLFKDFPRGMSAEWYLANLPKKKTNKKEGEVQDDEGEPGQSPGKDDKQNQSETQQAQTLEDMLDEIDTLDDHSGWGKCSQEVKDMANQRLKEIVKKAGEDCSRNNSWGSVTADVRKDIMKILETKVDWKKVLRFFVKASQKSNRSSSIKRINRRYAYIHPGKKSSRTARVAVSIDQSGSVDDTMLAKFFAELGKLAEIAEFVVVPFDTRVDESKVFVWKKGQNRKTERVLTGGTCFDAPTEYVNGKGFDGHIILTDMCAPKPKPSKCQRMWMTTKTYAERPFFETKERVVVVD